MIILGRKKVASIASQIKEKMEGKGQSDEDLKFDHEKVQKSKEDSVQALEDAASKIIDSIKGEDAKGLEHSLKEFIQLCYNK